VAHRRPDSGRQDRLKNHSVMVVMMRAVVALGPIDSEAGTLDRPGDGGDVGTGREAHFAALEVDGERRGAGTSGGTGDGLHAAVAIHAGDFEDQFFGHVI
jgi:hypothetical protein